MTVYKPNRSHRIAYLVFLLVAAVALTTALVLAAERGATPATQSSYLKTSASELSFRG
jgi:hypothetical protein